MPSKRLLAMALAILSTHNTWAATIAAGASHSVVFRSDGVAFAFGYNNSGQLGNNSTNSSWVPVKSSSLSGAVSVASGGSHTLALRSDGSISAWGSNSYGQIGNANTTDQATPVSIQVLTTGVSAISAGSNHSIALKDGAVYAWGYNYYGQLGVGSTQNYTVPQQVSSLSGITAIASSSTASFSLALQNDGAVWAWGQNSYGQLGDGTTTTRTTPVQVTNLTGVIAIAVGTGHALALKQDGAVWAWGHGAYGQLGDGSTSYSVEIPVQVSGLSGVVAISAGGNNSAAIKADGTVWVWGDNQYGQIGNGSATGSYSRTAVPAQVSGLTGISEISVGGNHVLARNAGGQVYAWGSDRNGQLGDGRGGYDSSYSYYFAASPSQVAGIGGDGYLNLVASGGTSCAGGSATQSDTIDLTLPCVVYQGTSFNLTLKLDGTIGGGTYFKMLTLSAN